MMKKILFALALVPAIAFAQSYPSPKFSSMTLVTPLTAANGGTGTTTSTGTGSAVLSSSPALTTPTMTSPIVTGAFTATGLVTTADLAAAAANTVLANVTGSSASPSAFAMPSCSTSTSALQWTSGSGFVCGTTFALTTGTLAQFSATTSAQLRGIISDETGSGAAVFGTSPTLTTPAISGGTINNASVGATTPSTGAFTTLSATTPIGTASGGTGITSFGTGVSSMLGAAANGTGGAALVNSSITIGDCMKWSATGVQDFGAICFDPNAVNVLAYGAVGNSNGTHGNGTDSTAAFQNAWNAAGTSGKTIFIPCGTFRITAPITTTDGNPRSIQGAGACSKIYSDQTTANTTFYFNPTTGTCGAQGNQPCAVVRDLTFTTPNTLGSGQSALYFNNYNSPYVDNVQFIGQQITATYINSFAPRYHNNRVYGGVTGIYSTDLSFNSGEIWSNSFYNMTGFGVQIAPSSNCAANVSIKNNDFEQAVVGVNFGGVCGGAFNDNYVENTHTQTPFTFTGTQNSSISFERNIINGATDSGTGALSIANITNAQFRNNNLLNIGISYGSGASQVRLRPSENTLFTATLPAPTVSCTGLGTGGTCTLSGDDQSGFVNMNTGTASVGSGGNITITFTNALGPNNASCSWTPIHNTGTWTAPATVIGSSAAKTSTIGQYWNGSSTVLTASKSYLMGYQCAGW